MGYSTDFSGKLKLNKQLSLDDKTFLEKLANTRRMARNVDPKYGVEGEFYVEGGGMMGQDRDDTIIDYNVPPKTQPGLWCQWVPTEDGWFLEWDGGEKFYNYVEWLEYLIEKVLKPRGYSLSGEIEWVGEDPDDRGMIRVKDNVVKTLEAKVVYEEEDERSGWWEIKFDGPEPSDSTLERIGNMIKDGYTSGDYYDKED
jgi:hypothetical protein